MFPDEEVFVDTVVSITSIRDDPWIVVFVGSLISWSSPYISHTSRSVSLFVLSSRSKFRSPILAIVTPILTASQCLFSMRSRIE